MRVVIPNVDNSLFQRIMKNIKAGRGEGGSGTDGRRGQGIIQFYQISDVPGSYRFDYKNHFQTAQMALLCDLASQDTNQTEDKMPYFPEKPGKKAIQGKAMVSDRVVF